VAEFKERLSTKVEESKKRKFKEYLKKLEKKLAKIKVSLSKGKNLEEEIMFF